MISRIREIKNAQLRTATEDAIDNPATCVRHHSGLDAGAKAASSGATCLRLAIQRKAASKGRAGRYSAWFGTSKEVFPRG